jgi:hypothetical protein
MIIITVNDTLKEQGIQAAANAYNKANPDQWISAADYMSMVVNSAAVSYANQFKVGIVSSGEYVLRFTAAENDAITAAAATDPIVDSLLNRVKESAEVVLYSDEVVQGVGYLVAQGLLTRDRGIEILAYTVAVDPPEPVEPAPEPTPEPEPEPVVDPEPDNG